MDRISAALWPAVQRISGDGRWPPATRSRCEVFIRTAVGERVAALLLESHDLPPLLASHVAAARTKLADCIARHSTAVDVTLDRLGYVLKGEPFAIFGGADVRARLYDDPSHRPVRQIDVLVPRERYAAALDRFRAAGIPQQLSATPAARVASHHRATFLADVPVVLHHSFVERARHRIDYDAIWSRTEPFTASGHEMRRLSADDAMVADAVTFAARCCDVPLIRFVDAARTLARDPELPFRLLAFAKSWRVQRAVYALLRQTSRLFGTTTHADLLLDAPTRTFLDAYVLRDPARRKPIPLVRSVWLMDGWTRRISFGASHGAATVVGWCAGTAQGAMPVHARS